jgi:hypothetical protein
MSIREVGANLGGGLRKKLPEHRNGFTNPRSDRFAITSSTSPAHSFRRSPVILCPSGLVSHPSS